MELQSTQVLDLAIAGDIVTAVTGSLIGAEAELFTNDVLPQTGSVAGDFNVPTYAGYAPEAVTWNAPSVTDEGNVEIIGIVGEFRPTNAVTPNSIFGLVIKNAGGQVLLGARFEDAPRPMNSALDAIIVTIRFRFTSGGLVVTIS